MVVTSLAGVAAVVPASADRAPHRAATARTTPRAGGPFGKIQHVVVIYQENRSFDEVLGAYCLIKRRCNGYVGPVGLKDGSIRWMQPSPDVVTPDPPHTIAAQVTAVDGGRMDGWGKLGSGCTSPGRNNCLTFYMPSQIPSMAALADRYVVSDHTFSMQNSSSFGGHMWVAAATQDNFTGDVPCCGMSETKGWGCDSLRFADWITPQGQITWVPSCVPAPSGFLDPAKYPYNGAWGPTPVPYVPTIFDRLDTAGLKWKLYVNIYKWAVCPTFAECIYGPQRVNMANPLSILTDAKSGTLPAYSVLLPSGPGAGPAGTGQHPPGSMLVGDNWIARVMNALQSSPQWSSTAVFITYDDCGCFFDHVPPGVNPDGTVQGPREPMIIASPYAKPATTDTNPATAASILRFTEEALGLAPLGVNDAQSYDYADAFDFTSGARTPRVELRQHELPAATRRVLHSLPSENDDDPT